MADFGVEYPILAKKIFSSLSILLMSHDLWLIINKSRDSESTNGRPNLTIRTCSAIFEKCSDQTHYDNNKNSDADQSLNYYQTWRYSHLQAQLMKQKWQNKFATKSISMEIKKCSFQVKNLTNNGSCWNCFCSFSSWWVIWKHYSIGNLGWILFWIIVV